MSVDKRGRVYHIRFRPFGPGLVTVSTNTEIKREAKRIERALLVACRAGDFTSLAPDEREVCTRMYRNQGMAVPSDLSSYQGVKEELTFGRAILEFLDDPEIRDSQTRKRYYFSFKRLLQKFGQERPVRSIRVLDLKRYRSERLKDGAKPATINWEMSTLSKLFTVLEEHEYDMENPVRRFKSRLSVKSSERQAYLSALDVQRISERSPDWLRPIIWTAYFTGMRRCEILGLTWRQVDLSSRMIMLRPDDVKEHDWKLVPIHRELAPILEQCRKVRSLVNHDVFLIDGRPVNPESIKNPWRRACKGLGLDPRPRFHDLRHTWKTNARRSKVDPEIRESIMGHWFKEKSVSERYGFISKQELIEAIDQMTFDHGPTQIRASK
jgi:integrase